MPSASDPRQQNRTRQPAQRPAQPGQLPAQPMQRSVLTTGILGDCGFPESEATICMAPTGQWRAQLPHSTLSVMQMQFSLIHTA